MDFITKIYTQILELIKTVLTVFGLDTTAVDELLAAAAPEAGEGEETPVA